MDLNYGSNDQSTISSTDSVSQVGTLAHGTILLYIHVDEHSRRPKIFNDDLATNAVDELTTKTL